MSMFYNNYQKLCQENNDAIAELSAANWNTLRKMFDYISSFNISLFELEVFKKDLIGIAKESDLEDIDLRDKLGVPETEFCTTMIQDALQRSRLESLVLIIRNIFSYLFVWYTVILLIEGLPENYGIHLWLVLFAVFDCMLRNVIDIRLLRRTTYMDFRKRKTIRTILAAIEIALIALLIYLPEECYLIRGDGRIIWLVLLVLALVSFFGNNYFWNRRSRNYNWQ